MGRAQSPEIFLISRPISCEDTNMANVEFGTGKTVLILTIVAACFAVLWPKIFYPMLVSSPGGKPQPNNMNGCCDVIFETDVNAIKIMSEMCGSIFKRNEDVDPKLRRTIYPDGKYSNKLVEVCRAEVMKICGIDLADILNEKVRLGHSYRQMLDEIRSYNISACLRQNFGVNPGSLGGRRMMRLWGAVSRELRQERPIHLRPEMMHPALRERGRAIPQSSLPTVKPSEKDSPTRPPPIPGMRPPMGGAGHVVPPPKVGTTMSIVMPLYTIGIVIFSMYTIMKVFIRKTGNSGNYKDFSSDPEFRRVVFADEFGNGCAASVKDDNSPFTTPPLFKTPSDDATRLVMTAITGLLAEVDQQLSREGDTQTQYSTDLKDEKKTAEKICTEVANGKKDFGQREQVDNRERSARQISVSEDNEEDSTRGDNEGKARVKVMGVETVAECEPGQKWSRPPSPTLGVATTRGSSLRLPPEPNDIFLEGAFPSQSQILVTDSKTQTLPQEDGPETPVILSGKVTLSLISVDASSSTDDTLHPPVKEKATGGIRYEEVPEGELDKADEDVTGNYTTATMSEEAAEIEDTRADISNIEGLDLGEEQEELEEDTHDWNPDETEKQMIDDDEEQIKD